MSKSYYEFFSPVKIIAGHSALENMPFELASLNASRAMVLTDKGIRQNKLIEPIETIFSTTNCKLATIYDDVPPDSSLQVVRAAAEAYRKNNCDSILAIGGGSVIDTAKAVNILVSENVDDLTEFSGMNNLKRPLKPLFVIPTTAGTGSEVTFVAVISDTEKNLKMAFASPYLMPHATILDPRMTLTLPPHITAMTAMDAMTHAIEAFSCLASNPISDAYATASIKKISHFLLPVLDNPTDANMRLELAQASTMAGIAFSNSLVGLVHSLGHALGAVSHLPHGLCMNLFLPYVLQYNKSINGDKLGELLLPLAGADVYAKTSKERRCDVFIEHILQLRDVLYERTKLPRSLSETNKVTRDQIPLIAEKAINDGSIIFNPKEANLQQLEEILNQAW